MRRRPQAEAPINSAPPLKYPRRGPRYRPNAVELAGAGLTIAALVANNLVARLPALAAAAEIDRYEYEPAEAA